MDNAQLLIENMTPVQKADLAVADLTTGGVLLPTPASAFIQDLIIRSKLMPLATVRPMSAQNENMPRIGFGQRVLRPANEATALAAGDRAKPTFTNTELTTKNFKGEVRIPDEVLEDNIERDQLKSTIMDLMSKAVARDLEQITILGDTTSTTDSFLAQFDGALRLATSHVVDWAGAALSRATFKEMVKTLPQVYKDDLPSMAFLTSTNAKLDVADSLGNRQTPGGDKLTFDTSEVTYQGSPVIDIPAMPDTLGNGSESNVLLMNPKNLTIGIWRQIRIESARDITTSETIIVVTIRVGVQYALEPAVVKAINVLSAA